MLTVHRTSFSKEITTREGVSCIAHPIDSILFVNDIPLNSLRYVREAMYYVLRRSGQRPISRRSKRQLIAYQPITTNSVELVSHTLAPLKYSGLYWYINEDDYPFAENTYTVDKCPIEGVAACWLKQGISMPYFEWVNRK